MSKKFISFVDEGLLNMTYTSRLQSYLEGNVVDVNPFDLFDVETPLAINSGYSKKDILNDFGLYTDMVHLKKSLYGIDYMYIGMDQKGIGSILGSETKMTEKGDSLTSVYALDDYKDFSKMENIDIKSSETVVNFIEKAKKTKEAMRGITIFGAVTGPLTTASGVRPVEKLLRDTRKNKEEIKRLLEMCTDYTIEFVKIFTEEVGGCFFKIADPVSSLNVISKKQYDEITQPYMEKLSDSVYEITGIKPMVHICGKTDKVWENFRDSSFSRFSVDNIEDIGELKNSLGDNMIIEGNIAPMDILLNSDPETVRNEVKTLLQKASDSPKGYILNAGCTVCDNTPIENIESYIRAVCEFGKDASIGNLPKGLTNI